jgi:hypothetical protein
MIMGGFQLFKQQGVVSEAISASNAKLQEVRLKNVGKYREIQQKLEVLYAKENPSDRDRWHINHLEKTSNTLEKAIGKLKTATDTKRWTNRMFVENGIMMLLLVVGLGIQLILQYRNDKAHPPRKGLSSPMPWSVPSNDPVSEKTHWQAMRSGGANFKTHKLIETAEKLIIRSSAQLVIFYGLFIAIGLNNVLFNYIEVIYQSGVEAFINDPGLIFSQWKTVGTSFVVVGFVIRFLMGAAPTVFDRQKQTFTTGNDDFSFSQVHAIQVIEELAGGRGAGVFKSYEMNLVLNDGNRIHLMDHGDFSVFSAQVQRLSDFLNVPIWQA